MVQIEQSLTAEVAKFTKVEGAPGGRDEDTIAQKPK